jgi:hypothetical protein
MTCVGRWSMCHPKHRESRPWPKRHASRAASSPIQRRPQQSPSRQFTYSQLVNNSAGRNHNISCDSRINFRILCRNGNTSPTSVYAASHDAHHTRRASRIARGHSDLDFIWGMPAINTLLLCLLSTYGTIGPIGIIVHVSTSSTIRLPIYMIPFAELLFFRKSRDL